MLYIHEFIVNISDHQNIPFTKTSKKEYKNGYLGRFSLPCKQESKFIKTCLAKTIGAQTRLKYYTRPSSHFKVPKKQPYATFKG